MRLPFRAANDIQGKSIKPRAMPNPLIFRLSLPGRRGIEALPACEAGPKVFTESVQLPDGHGTAE